MADRKGLLVTRLVWFAAGVVAGAVWLDVSRSGVLAEIIDEWSEALGEAVTEAGRWAR